MASTKRMGCAVAQIMAVAGLMAAATPLTAAAGTKVTIGITAGGAGLFIPTYIAMDKGFYAREGLDAEFVAMSGKALVTAGLGGALNFLPLPGGASQATLKGAKLRFIVGQSLISQWTIVVPKEINSVQELKGKTLGYSRPGAADYDEGEIVLSRFFNMEVGRDYNVISLASEADRIAALLNNNIQGALVSLPHAARAQVAGYKVLIRLGEYLPRVGGTYWVTEDYFQKNPDTVKRFIRAMARAEEFLADDRDGSVPIIQKYFGIKDAKEAGFIWDQVHDTYGPDIPEKLYRDLYDGRIEASKKAGLWAKDKPMPDIEAWVGRDRLTGTLREMGYYLQRSRNPAAKTN